MANLTGSELGRSARTPGTYPISLKCTNAGSTNELRRLLVDRVSKDPAKGVEFHLFEVKTRVMTLIAAGNLKKDGNSCFLYKSEDDNTLLIKGAVTRKVGTGRRGKYEPVIDAKFSLAVDNDEMDTFSQQWTKFAEFGYVDNLDEAREIVKLAIQLEEAAAKEEGMRGAGTSGGGSGESENA